MQVLEDIPEDNPCSTKLNEDCLDDLDDLDDLSDCDSGACEAVKVIALCT